MTIAMPPPAKQRPPGRLMLPEGIVMSSQYPEVPIVLAALFGVLTFLFLHLFQ